MRSAALLCALALAAAAAQGADGVIYKSVLPSGAVVYGDAPIAGARSVEPIVAPPPAPAPAGGKPAARSPLAEAADARWRALETTGEDISRAYRRLEAAKAAQEEGRAAGPGDISGTVYGGRRRFSAAYVERQRALAAEVGAAQAELDAAIARRNALR
jgi:hypothetical protein